MGLGTACFIATPGPDGPVVALALAECSRTLGVVLEYGGDCVTAIIPYAFRQLTFRMTWNNIRRIGPGKDIEAGMENQFRTGNRAMVLRPAAVVMCMWSLQLAAQVTSTTYADLDARKMVDASYATRSFMGAAAGFAIDGEFVWQYAVGLSDASDSTLFLSLIHI